jgi:hypothetical protein
LVIKKPSPSYTIRVAWRRFLGKGEKTLEQDKMSQGRILYPAAALLSVVAALAHLWAMPEHFREWWGYGAFFLVVALAQGLYGLGLLRWPSRALFVAGLAGNLAVLGLFGVVHTRGIPFFGPHAGEAHRARSSRSSSLWWRWRGSSPVPAATRP